MQLSQAYGKVLRMKTLICLFVGVWVGMMAIGVAEETVSFRGTVTAVNSNANRPGYSFTAVNELGQVKMFYIASLKHLEVQDRVELTYRASDKFPLNVIRIRFLPPASGDR